MSSDSERRVVNAMNRFSFCFEFDASRNDTINQLPTNWSIIIMCHAKGQSTAENTAGADRNWINKFDYDSDEMNVDAEETNCVPNSSLDLRQTEERTVAPGNAVSSDETST